MLQRIIAAQLQVHFYVRLSNIAGEHSRNVSEILQQWSHRNVSGSGGRDDINMCRIVVV